MVEKMKVEFDYPNVSIVVSTYNNAPVLKKVLQAMLEL